MDTPGCLPVFGLSLQHQLGVNPPDHQDVIFGFYFSDGFGHQPLVRGIDLTRFQRASECAGESTGGSRDNVIERGGMRLQHLGRYFVMFGHCPMHPE